MDQTVQGVNATEADRDAGFGQYNLVGAQTKMIPGLSRGRAGSSSPPQHPPCCVLLEDPGKRLLIVRRETLGVFIPGIRFLC